jgi:hypothetical protein
MYYFNSCESQSNKRNFNHNRASYYIYLLQNCSTYSEENILSWVQDIGIQIVSLLKYLKYEMIGI